LFTHYKRHSGFSFEGLSDDIKKRSTAAINFYWLKSGSASIANSDQAVEEPTN